MASFLDRIGKIFKGSSVNEVKRKKICHNIRFNENPEDFWTLVGELGDGAFGKVHKVSICQSYKNIRKRRREGKRKISSSSMSVVCFSFLFLFIFSFLLFFFFLLLLFSFCFFFLINFSFFLKFYF